MKRVLQFSLLTTIAALLIGCGGGGTSGGTTGGNSPLTFHFNVNASQTHQTNNGYAFSIDNAGHTNEIDFTPNTGSQTYSVFVDGASVNFLTWPNQDPAMTSLVTPVMIRDGRVVDIFKHTETGNTYLGVHFWSAGGDNTAAIEFNPLDMKIDGSMVLMTIVDSSQYNWLDLQGNYNTQFHFPTYTDGPNNGHILFTPSKLCFSSSGRAAYSPSHPEIDPNYYIIGDGIFYRTLDRNGHLVAMNAHDEVVGTTTDDKWGIYWDANGHIQQLPKLDVHHISEVPTGIADDGTIIGTWKTASASGGIIWALNDNNVYGAHDFTPNVTSLPSGTSVKAANAISPDGTQVSIGIMAPGDALLTIVSASRVHN